MSVDTPVFVKHSLTAGSTATLGQGELAVNHQDGNLQWMEPDGSTHKTPLKDYIHVQPGAATVWTIVHNQNYYPRVTVLNAAGEVVLAEVDYINTNEIHVSFNTAMSGRAVLN